MTPGTPVRITRGTHAGRTGSIAKPSVGTWPDTNGLVGIDLSKVGAGTTKATKAGSLLFTPSQFTAA
jgi:hypothetical protein